MRLPSDDIVTNPSENLRVQVQSLSYIVYHPYIKSGYTQYRDIKAQGFIS